MVYNFFWGNIETYEPTKLEEGLFIINNFTWFITIGVFYLFNREHNDRYLPTYSFMVRHYPAKFVHILFWFFGFFIRFVSILIRYQGVGLSIILPFILFSWTGTTFYTMSSDNLKYNETNKTHIQCACFMFGLMFILNGFYCINNISFIIKFALMLLSTQSPWKRGALFSIMEHTCVHHVCMNSYPLLT